MELVRLLTQFGLEDKEAIIYLTCLQLGKDTAFHIAERCKLKRSTVYVVLHNLNVKGFVAISKTKKATLYEAASPKKLLQSIDFRKAQIEDALPLLLALYKDKPEKPRIQVLEGKAAVEQVYQEAIDYVKQGKEVLAFSTLLHFQTTYKSAFDRWVKDLRKIQFRAREILNIGEFEFEYIQKVKQYKNPRHQIRVVPKGTFSNDNTIYGDTLAIFSVTKDLFVILIESKEIAQSYRNFFEFVWHGAEEVS